MEKTNEEKQQKFMGIKAGDVVIAKYPDSGKNKNNVYLYQPFFIVGRSAKYLHAIYCTTKTRHNKGYYPISFDGSNKITYLDCTKIINLSIDEFKWPSKYKVCPCDAKKVIKKMLNYSQIYNQIDFKEFFNEIKIGNIVLCDNKFYVISGFSENGYEARLLRKKRNNESKSTVIFGKKYVIAEGEKHVLKSDKIMVITDDIVFRLYDVKSYQYADVLSIKGSKNKIIYITKSNKKIYYVTYDDIDFFRGISRIDKTNVITKYSRLSDYEIEKLTKKISMFLGLEKERFTDKNLNELIFPLTLRKK